MSLWSELKRRNVLRVGVAYLVSSWVLIEVGSVLFESFGFPPFALQLLITILGLGVVPVAIFAWVFELTPEGIVRDKGAGADNPEAERTAQRLNQVTIALIIVALAFVVLSRFVLPDRQAPGRTGDVLLDADNSASGPETETRQAPSSAAVSPDVPAASIAVLPFANMSPDPDNAFFADGIAEEILNVLASIDGLKVASRTSAFSFRNTNTPISTIASQLGVAKVLEGSVRKQGVRVRITAQLIDAATDAHVWSESYDRDLTDVFAVQEEIANAITQALGDTLGVRSVSVYQSTGDIEAYEQFLLGRTLFYQRYAALTPARAALEDAVARDPAFADAWAYLAATCLVAPGYLFREDDDRDDKRAEVFECARGAAERARALNDKLSLPHAVLASLAGHNNDWLAAERLYDTAIERDPDNSTVRMWRGLHFFQVGHFKTADIDLARAVEIDPLVGINSAKYGRSLLMQGRIDEAVPLLERAVALGYPAPGWTLAALDLQRGERDEAVRKMRLIFQDEIDPDAKEAADLVVAVISEPARAQELYDLYLANPALIYTRGALGPFLALAGLYNEAIDADLDPRLPRFYQFPYEYYTPLLRNVIKEPRFLELAEAYGMLAYWQAKGYPDDCRLVEEPARRLECDW